MHHSLTRGDVGDVLSVIIDIIVTLEEIADTRTLWFVSHSPITKQLISFADTELTG